MTGSLGREHKSVPGTFWYVPYPIRESEMGDLSCLEFPECTVRRQRK